MPSCLRAREPSPINRSLNTAYRSAQGTERPGGEGAVDSIVPYSKRTLQERPWRHHPHLLVPGPGGDEMMVASAPEAAYAESSQIVSGISGLGEALAD